MGASNAPTRSRRARGVGESPPDAYWAGPGHPLGWTYGSEVYGAAKASLGEREHVRHPFDLRGLRAVLREDSSVILIDAAKDHEGYRLRCAFADEAAHPPYTWPEECEVVYSLAASLATFARALAALPDAAQQGHFFFYGPHEPFQVVAGSDAVVVSSRWACPSEHRRNDGRCYEAGVAHECPVRDCVMGRLYGWDWRPPTRWEFCEAIGEQGRSAWVPVPADAPRTEPCEVGTEAVPLAHRFHRDGRP